MKSKGASLKQKLRERINIKGKLASRNLGSVVDTAETLLLYRYLDCSLSETIESMLLGLITLDRGDGNYLVTDGIERGRFDATAHVYLALLEWRDFLKNSDSLIKLEIEEKLEIIELKSCLFKDGNTSLAGTRNLTRFWACARGLVSWDTFPPVTRELLGTKFTLNVLKKNLSPWMFLALEVMSLVMRNQKLTRPSTFSMRSKLELIMLNSARRFVPQFEEQACLYLSDSIPAQQNSDGSFFGVSQMTIYGLMGLKELGFQNDSSEIRTGLDFLKSLQHQENGFLVQDPFVGPIWETSHGLLALSPEEDADLAQPLIEYLLSQQTSCGGWSYQENNPNYPDCDDTALAILALNHHKVIMPSSSYGVALKKALNWLLKMQNSDGSWAAWSRDQFSKNRGHYGIANQGFFKHAIVNDFGSADVTGHALMALGSLGYTLSNKVVSKALKYLRLEQLSFGGFWARWGVNYLYGTSRVLLGLKSIGLENNDNLIQNSLSFLLSCQNTDGGFGEDPESYFDVRLAGKGGSSVQQTAWVIRSLIEWLPKDHIAIKKGIAYLEQSDECSIRSKYFGVSMPPLMFAYTDLVYWNTLEVLTQFEKLTQSGN